MQRRGSILVTRTEQPRLRYPLLACLLVVVVLAFLVFRPFLEVFTVAASLTLLLVPIHRRLGRFLGGRSALAAALLVLFTTLAILIPVLSSAVIVSQQSSSFIEWLGP